MRNPSQDPRWPTAHRSLKKLYEERSPKGMTQAEFGATYGIGTQGMVWQYLNGRRPLNLDAAAKFARGLRCTIYDISPEMAQVFKEEVVPVLGPKAWMRAAMMFLAILVWQPEQAQAAFLRTISVHVYYVKSAWRRVLLLLSFRPAI